MMGDQPLLKSSTSVGPATVSTSLVLNQGQFAMKTAGDFSQVTSLAEADAHLLPDDLSEARLEFADDLSHPTCAQKFDVGF